MWGKVIKGEKIVKSATIEVDEYKSTFFQMTKALCEKLQIPTPIVISKNVLDFKMFNLCMFKKNDFVESVNFDIFSMHNVTAE